MALGSLFVASTVSAVERALAPLGGLAADGGGVAGERVGVVGPPRIGKALAARGLPVVVMSDRPRALRRLPGERAYGVADALPLADGGLAALVGFGLAQRDDWEALLSEWSRAVAGGGLVVLVDRAAPVELTRRALCGGLAEIAQSQAGRNVVTSGRVWKL